MTYIRVHKGRGLIILAITVIILCIGVLLHIRNGSAVFGSCAQARRSGYSNIPMSNHLYNPALDRDHDNVACE